MDSIDTELINTTDSGLLKPAMEPIEIRGAYFLGQEDRDPLTGVYGIGNYLHLVNAAFSIELHDAQARKVIDKVGQVYVLLSEPDMDMFRTYRLFPWNAIYKRIYYRGDDWTDYAPAAYLSFTAFADKKLEIFGLERE